MSLPLQKPQIPTSVVEARRDEIGDDWLVVQAWTVKDKRLERIHRNAQMPDKLPIDVTGAYFFAAALPPRAIPYQPFGETPIHNQRVSRAQGN
ncbi:hypothetical protein NC981_23350 [Leptolyngbya sp. DQ-M1]|uniref:hypothetical protein n=1 Tax=Leptolyngbya sp. DQ-M1 TaxID=2933920 RepID=UPI003296B6DB